jgi:hypothetical protein
MPASHIGLTQGKVFRDITLPQAIELVDKHCDLVPQVLIERYPPYRGYAPCTPGNPTGGIFAYQFFNTEGLNCAYYLQDMHSLHILVPARLWGFPKEELEDISSEIERIRQFPSPFVAELLADNTEPSATV